MTVIDLFAGCGGWDVGARDLGIDPIGIEMDADACATRALHGMPTIRADLTTLDPLRFAGIDGLIASPPCQDWSMAGSRKGITGETGRLVMEVLRWATAIGPRWVACEQVPPALPVWEFFAHHLRDFGYKTWTGVLEAERYGVPQTRERAFLLAHRDHQPEPPVPTHQRYVSGEPARYEPASMFHAEILPWVSAAEACGWGRCDGTMEHQRGAGMAERHGDRDPRPIHAPAPTMTAGAGRRIKVDRWIDTRRDQRPDGNAIRLNIAEGLVLQSFPHDFALAGNKTSQWRQVGNAVPPLLSKVTLAALLRLESEAVATFACTCADVLVTDPPYGMSYESNGSRDTRMCSTCGFTAYIDDCWCDREQCEHTEWVPEIESWVRCTANTLMHTPDTRVLCPAHCGCGGGGANA